MRTSGPAPPASFLQDGRRPRSPSPRGPTAKRFRGRSGTLPLDNWSSFQTPPCRVRDSSLGCDRTSLSSARTLRYVDQLKPSSEPCAQETSLVTLRAAQARVFDQAQTQASQQANVTSQAVMPVASSGFQCNSAGPLTELSQNSLHRFNDRKPIVKSMQSPLPAPNFPLQCTPIASYRLPRQSDENSYHSSQTSKQLMQSGHATRASLPVASAASQLVPGVPVQYLQQCSVPLADITEGHRQGYAKLASLSAESLSSPGTPAVSSRCQPESLGTLALQVAQASLGIKGHSTIQSPPRASVSQRTTCAWPSSAALSRFSTGAVSEVNEPEIRAGWFKSPVEATSMEQLNYAHERGWFTTLQLDHTEAWKEFHVDFCKGWFGSTAQVNILSGRAAVGGQFQRPKDGCVAIYFPGFQVVSIKLLFRNMGTACCTMPSPDSAFLGLQYAGIQLSPSALPLGFSVNLKRKLCSDLTRGEQLARAYFLGTIAPALGGANDQDAARIEGLVEGMAPGEQMVSDGCIPAIFDDRPGSKVVSLKFRSVAQSASAPRFLELWQSPPGEPAQVTHVLLKRGDNPHLDRFALAMARVFNHLWREEGVAVSVAGQPELVQNVLYRVLQAGVRTSVIEAVPGCSPVRSFHDRHSKVLLAMFGDAWWQGDLNDWVPSAPLLASAAAAFTTAYVLDVADRHQDNMLVTREGRLFNIDFGYLFGEHPRLVDAKPFAIPVAFRTALVQSGQLWGIFKAACVKAFAALVKHREFVILQAIEISRALGSHFLMTHALTFGKRLVDPGIQVALSALAGRSGVGTGFDTAGSAINSLDMFPDACLDSFVEVVGCQLSQSIDRGVHGHQRKDFVHERRCVLM